MNQPQVDGSIRSILYISRATLPNEANWSPLELDGGVITGAIKRLRHDLFHVPFEIYTDHGALEQLAKVGEHNPRVQRWLEFPTAYQYTIKHRPGKTNGNTDFLSGLPLPPTAADFSPACCLTKFDEPGIYPVRFSTPVYALDLQYPETGMHMDGLRPLPYDVVWVG